MKDAGGKMLSESQEKLLQRYIDRECCWIGRCRADRLLQRSTAARDSWALSFE